VFSQDELEKHLYYKGENTQGWNKNDTSWISIMEKYKGFMVDFRYVKGKWMSKRDQCTFIIN
jgi:hypothetical protein